MYLLDVSGHGIGPALLSVSALNMIRSQTLPNTDFTVPHEVLSSLNRSFPMELHDNLYFTIWYAVFNPVTRQLAFAGAGHPPPLLIQKGSGPSRLTTENASIGFKQETRFTSSVIDIRCPAVLYIFSDGVFEIECRDGSLWTGDELSVFLADSQGKGPSDTSEMDRLYDMVLEMSGRPSLDDDFSMLKVLFNEE